MEIDDEGLEDDVQAQLRDSVQAVLKRYPNHVNFEEGQIREELKKFASLETYKQINIKDCLNITQFTNPFSIVALEVDYNFSYVSKYDSTIITNRECQLYGYARTESSLGHVFIRPEKLEDKFAELFMHKEIDFPNHPEFSRKYYMLADHPDRVRQDLKKGFLDQCCLFHDLIVEMVDGAVLITTRKIIAPEETLKFCGFFEKVVGEFLL